MSEKIKALVVEDDMDIQEEIKDVLSAMGHEHDWAACQSEARELIEAGDYDYVLADLEIPARARGLASIDYGRQFVEQIQRIKGRAVVPVIIMTGHCREGLNLAKDLCGNGAMDFISKPFGDAASGKSLSQVIQGVLEKHRSSFPPGTLPTDPPTVFRGGPLVFYPDQIELCGEILFESDKYGHSWEIMQILSEPRLNGKLPYYNAPKLANKVDSTGQLTEGAIASCIHDMRTRICNTMLEKANITVAMEDVITNKNRGYHLTAWLAIENHDTTPSLPAVGQTATDATNASKKSESAAQSPLTARHHWILNQLRKSGIKLTRADVEKEFNIGDQQAKRVLFGLAARSLIEFKRKPHPGFYVLCKK